MFLSFETYAKINGNEERAERYDTVVLANTQIRKIHSKSTGVDYKIYISFPAGYLNNKSGRLFPVLYLLDADYSFALTKQIADHLMERSRINEIIIVGIAYDGPLKYKLNRTRDYTPSKVLGEGYGPEYEKHSGGADRFYRFLKTELIPYIDANFSANNDRTITGHSYGGLFASYVLVNYPDIFNNAVIVSPSLWYDDGLILKQAKAKGNFNSLTVHKIYLSVGEKENGGNHMLVDELREFSAAIEEKPHHNINLSVDIVSDLDHDTVFPTAITNGLIGIFN